jgi:hypothetical protein
MVVPNTGNIFNVPNPTMSIDYRRPVRELTGWFWRKDQLSFGIEFGKLTAKFSYSNGSGGCVPQITMTAYPPAWDFGNNPGWWLWGGAAPSNGEIPPDGVWRTFQFSYDPITGTAQIRINNPAHTQVFSGTPGMNFCGWTASNMDMLYLLDNSATGAVGNVTAFVDNASYGRITPLPVLLEYFKAEQEGSGVNLYWKTTSEHNNMGFILYRSDDNDHWTEIAKVEARRTTGEPIAYHFRDTRPLSGTSFYRLRQIDMNGASTGYPSVKVEVNFTDHGLLGIYPNPVNHGILNFKFESPSENEPLEVDVLNLNGQLLRHSEFRMHAGVNDMGVEVSGLASGMYLAVIRNGNRIHSERFSVVDGN